MSCAWALTRHHEIYDHWIPLFQLDDEGRRGRNLIAAGTWDKLLNTTVLHPHVILHIFHVLADGSGFPAMPSDCAEASCNVRFCCALACALLILWWYFQISWRAIGSQIYACAICLYRGMHKLASHHVPTVVSVLCLALATPVAALMLVRFLFLESVGHPCCAEHWQFDGQYVWFSNKVFPAKQEAVASHQAMWKPGPLRMLPSHLKFPGWQVN